MEHLAFPNEGADYRAARNTLLDAEVALRRQIEAVAAQRRALPPGGAVPRDYVFERIGKNRMPEQVRMSELFGDKPSLLLYSFMYGPDRDQPCTGCTHLLDAIEGAARHAPQRIALHVVAKSPIERLAAWAHDRGWDHLSLISTAGNSYDADYFGDTSRVPAGVRRQNGYEDGKDWDQPIANVFRRDADGIIRHFWGTELTYAPEEPGQHHRALDLVDPLWGLLEMTPEGRGDFFPKLGY